MNHAAQSDPLVAAFATLSTPTISDALDRLSIPGQPVGIRPLIAGPSMCGRAFTVGYVPVQPRSGQTVGDFIDDVGAGSVVVIDNGGRLDATVWGDLMTSVAARNGVAGTVIDGVCRDTARAEKIGYPIYSRARFMRTGKDRVTVAAIGVPVRLSEHRVDAGDIIVGDADGVVIVPAGHAEQTLEMAHQVEAAEDGIRALIEQGLRLDEARAQHRYHQLQTPTTGRDADARP